MAMFSFTKVDNWRTANFFPNFTRLHQIASQISIFQGVTSPDPHPCGGDTPSLDPSPVRRFGHFKTTQQNLITLNTQH